VGQTIGLCRLPGSKGGRVEKAPAPLFHEVSRAEGPGGQTTKSDGLPHKVHRGSQPPQIRTGCAGPRRFRAILFSRSRSAANEARATASCFKSSPTSRRTNTSVSSAIVPSHHLASDGSTYPRGRFRFAAGPQTAGDLLQVRGGETSGGTRRNPVVRAISPGLGTTYALGLCHITPTAAARVRRRLWRPADRPRTRGSLPPAPRIRPRSTCRCTTIRFGARPAAAAPAT